jgi:dihydrodipicolinate synthase/N-acetylneuraminate lyase
VNELSIDKQEVNAMNCALDLIRPRRKIVGMSAVFLPFHHDGSIDWAGFSAHLERTVTSGLMPAVNMDTGSVQFLEAGDRVRVLEVTGETCKRFVAGACVVDAEQDQLDTPAYQQRVAEIADAGGTPVIFPSWGLNRLEGEAWIRALTKITSGIDFVGFELGRQFVPYGRIFDLATYRELIMLPNCLGAKHSSLDRMQEWDRIRLRNEIRPDFQVLTGNDLAIDMVMYGSDYLLGLSSFAPELFAKRDAYWQEGNDAFYSLNDLLQYLGQFVFRAPVPSYKHSAAQFLQLCGTLESDQCPPGISSRPESDLLILEDMARRLELKS